MTLPGGLLAATLAGSTLHTFLRPTRLQPLMAKLEDIPFISVGESTICVAKHGKEKNPNGIWTKSYPLHIALLSLVLIFFLVVRCFHLYNVKMVFYIPEKMKY